VLFDVARIKNCRIIDFIGWETNQPIQQQKVVDRIAKPSYNRLITQHKEYQMHNHRAKQYQCAVTRSDGTQQVDLFDFTIHQADSVGAILHPDGINLTAAMKLCDRWTRRHNHADIQYSYKVPFTKVVD
jgi:hypothetical protein